MTALKSLGKEADRVTIATDYDREGELIGVEALNILKQVNPHVPFDRVRYSAITPKAIEAAFANPTNVDFNLADAGHSRQVIDLVWGAALTRYISLAAGRLGKNVSFRGKSTVPNLSLIVDREKERNIFVPTLTGKSTLNLKTRQRRLFQPSTPPAVFWTKRKL